MNSTTRLYLVCSSYEIYTTMHGSMNIKFIAMTLCILALFIQHAMRMRRIILSSVAGLSLPYFSTLPYKEQDFRKKNCGL